MTYRLYIRQPRTEVDAAAVVYENGASVSFCFDPANTDYQQFKAEINNDTAQLEDAEGVLMTPEEAKAFVATLP